MAQTPPLIGGFTPRILDLKKKCCEGWDWSKIEDEFYRISVSLINIIANLEALPKILEDLEDDPVKACKKQIEFSTRFTRNHLCELRQKMNGIKRFLEHSDNVGSSKNQMIFYSFTSSFHMAHQAFQNIEKNLRYVIFNKLPVQISEFLNCFSDLCIVTNAAYWEGNNEKLMELEDLNLTLITKLDDIQENLRKEEAQKKEKQRTILQVKKEIKKSPVKSNKWNNLSMYKSAHINNFEKMWKKKTKALAEAKFGNKQGNLLKVDKPKEESPKSLKCKDKVEEKHKIKELPVKNHVKEEPVSRPKRKVAIPIPENEIETLVQSIELNSASEDDNDNEKEENEVAEELKENNELSEPPLNSIIEAEKFPMGPVLDEAFKTMFNHIMSQVMTNIDPTKKPTAIDEDFRNLVAKEVKRSNFRQDNVKLICMVEGESNFIEVQN